MVIKNLKNTNKFAEEDFVWRVLAQLATALYRCHYGTDAPPVGSNLLGPPQPRSGLKGKQAQIMILHRDLKPENSKCPEHYFSCCSLTFNQFSSEAITVSNLVTLACRSSCNPTTLLA